MTSKRLKVFVVEDEAMIRMMVVDMIEELGHTVAAEAGSLDQALKFAQASGFDVAILDMNVNGQMITPVAEAIQARGLPFIFATGYGIGGLPEQFKDSSALQNLSSLNALGAAINAVGPFRA
jgi:CheY-like chemotaxis protein